ncbi:MAG: T9SS type A sorting domain-containing protein [Syntrophothermus sp.]
MKLKMLLLAMLVISYTAFGQKVYPLKTIKELQFVSDSALIANPKSQPAPYSITKDTVRVRGVVMVAPVTQPGGDTAIIYAGQRYSIYIQDPAAKEWGGLVVLQNDRNKATMMDVIDTAQVVEFTGFMSEYQTTSQFNLISGTNPILVNPVETLPKRPAALVMKISDFMNNGVTNPLMEKYEGMYVEFRNVTVTDRNTADGTFTIMDDAGNYVWMYDQSGYFSLRSTNKIAGSTYQVPENGTKLEYIRGMIQDWWGTTKPGPHISPLYPGDMKIASMPPTVSTIKRNTDLVLPNQSVEVTAKVTAQTGGTISEAKLYYRVNGGSYASAAMTVTSDPVIYKATIPGVKDSALVDFFIQAKDNAAQITLNPADTSKNNYFYMVLNRPLTIRDVQYSPFGSGYSAYNNYRVTVSGTVVADTTDLPGDGGASGEIPRVYMQDGNTAWSGLWIYGQKAYDLRKGDNVTVSGTITESGSNTRIDTITTITVNSKNNTVPAAVVLKTSDIGTSANGTVSAEKWEGMLVKYTNVTVDKENADGNPGPNVTSVNSNFGELLVSDASKVGTRVELQDGASTYNNFWDSLVVKKPGYIRVKNGDQFSAISGILIYSYSNYKIFPRKNSDFEGYKTDVKNTYTGVAKDFSLTQNYPNPFNPSTSIQYSVPADGFVTLKVFNALGQEVRTLVNQYQGSGNYKVTFNANDLPSGVYLYKLSAGSFNLVKKMMLVK